MYPSHGAPMAPPQKPETFMLSREAQESLPQEARIALQQVDNCESTTPGANGLDCGLIARINK